jgi:hypothetical protein
VVVAIAVVAFSACNRSKPVDAPRQGIFSAPAGSWRVEVDGRHEILHAEAVDDAATGSRIALHTARYRCAAEWEMIDAGPARVVVRERITQCIASIEHDDPWMELAFEEQYETSMPETLRNEISDLWLGYEFRTVYAMDGTVTTRSIVSRPPRGAGAEPSGPALEEALAGTSRIYPGAPPPLSAAGDLSAAAPPLINPVPVIRWPQGMLKIGDTWQQGRREDALLRLETIEDRDDARVSEASWEWTIGPEQYPENVRAQMEELRIRMEAEGRATLDFTHVRVLDYVSTDTQRHFQEFQRGDRSVEAEKRTSTTVRVQWTYGAPAGDG